MDRQDRFLEMPENINRIRYGVKYISKSRIWMSSELESRKKYIIKDIR